MKQTTPIQGEPLVTVVIVNFNGGELILDCLKALQHQTFRGFVTVVIDNASTDNSPEEIIRQHPEVALLPSAENLGFAGGVNLALQEVVESEWLALLNPDTTPEPGWLEALLHTAQKHPEAAAFGSKMFIDADPDRLDGSGDVYHVSGLAWRRGHGQFERSQDRVGGEIFSPCAAAALYRTAVVRQVGGMDADLFCYLEDVDLGFRLRLAGFTCYYVPQARLRHKGSAIVGRHSDFQTYHGHRNMVWVFLKNMPNGLLLLLLPLHIAMNAVTLTVLVFQGRGRPALRAKRDAIAGLPDIWRKRRSVQQLRRVGLWALARELSWLPFRR